jgi:DNA-binding FadR family transcriptional regulator
MTDIKPNGRHTQVRPVRKAFEQAADQLRQLIVGGELSVGERLPSETELAREFGISRATVREALRLLTAQNLIRTTKGAAGGSYITLPTIDHLSDFMSSSIGALTQARDVSLDELLEARELLEVPAARLAAERRRDQDLDMLRQSIPEHPLHLDRYEQFDANRQFHTTILEACGNSLVFIAAQPIFSILQTHLARSTLGRTFHKSINDHHHEITAAIEAGSVDAAGEAMREHLRFLRPAYERAWRDALRVGPGRP